MGIALMEPPGNIKAFMQQIAATLKASGGDVVEINRTLRFCGDSTSRETWGRERVKNSIWPCGSNPSAPKCATFVWYPFGISSCGQDGMRR